MISYHCLALTKLSKSLCLQWPMILKSGKFWHKVFFRGLMSFQIFAPKIVCIAEYEESNLNVTRYNLSDEEIIDAAAYSYEQKLCFHCPAIGRNCFTYSYHPN